MPRPKNPIDIHRDEITTRVQANTPIDQILQSLRTDHQIKLSKATLERRLRVWGVQSPRYHTCAAPETRKALIFYSFYQRLATDAEIVSQLESAGMPTSLRQVKHLRICMGLRRKREARNPGYVDAGPGNGPHGQLQM